MSTSQNAFSAWQPAVKSEDWFPQLSSLSNEMKLRVGIVGLGDGWEQRHRPALRALHDRFEVRAIHSGVALLAEHAAREFKAVAVDGFRALARRPDVDAVLALKPDWYGATLPVLAACDAGKAIYCATTLDLDPNQSLALKQRVDKSGVAFMAEFPRRYSPATIRLKELIATRLGQPKLLFCHRRLSDEESLRTGRAKSSRELIELVDWCRYVVGKSPSSVLGICHGSDSTPEQDYEMMSLDFSSPGTCGKGPLAQISCSRYISKDWHEAIHFRPPASLQVSCERGVAFLDLPSSITWFDEAGRHHESLEGDRPVGEQLLTLFHRSVTSFIRKMTSLEDAYAALAIVAGAEMSCKSGTRVMLDL